MASYERWALNAGLTPQQGLHVILPLSLSRRPQREGGQILRELEDALGGDSSNLPSNDFRRSAEAAFGFLCKRSSCSHSHVGKRP